jgi:IS605 OrfB family transposase
VLVKHRKPGRPGKEKPYKVRNISDKGGDGGNASGYLLRRLTRDHPVILASYERSEEDGPADLRQDHPVLAGGGDKRGASPAPAVLHEVSDLLTKQFHRIVIEDLAVKNMVKNHNLARSIMDAGWGSLRRMLEYKAELRGCKIIIAPRFFPSSKTCSCCGVIKDELTLDERVFHCDECGFECDRDLNAALNLLRLDTFRPVEKRAEEPCKTSGLPEAAVLTPRTGPMDFIGF